MDELGVRTLSGLNLREALETLRRKHLRAGDAPVHEPPMASTPAPAGTSRPAAPRPAPAAPPPLATPAPIAPSSSHYFEEEDDSADYTFDLEEDVLAPAAPLGALVDDDPPLPDDEYFDLAGELPDFDALPAMLDETTSVPPAPARTNTRSAPTPRTPPSRATSAAPASAGEAVHSAPATAARTTGPLAGAEHMRGLPRLGQLRAIPPGGAATPYQQNAYQNLVVSQLGEEATALVSGIWRTTPTQLGSDQLDALIRWAKEDAFQEEAQQVLAALEAERARAAAEHGAANGRASAAAPDAPGRAGANGAPPRRASGSRSRESARDSGGGR
jgi:hypothetical protein